MCFQRHYLLTVDVCLCACVFVCRANALAHKHIHIHRRTQRERSHACLQIVFPGSFTFICDAHTRCAQSVCVCMCARTRIFANICDITIALRQSEEKSLCVCVCAGINKIFITSMCVRASCGNIMCHNQCAKWYASTVVPHTACGTASLLRTRHCRMCG